ncbi:MAG: hypothetical protein F6K31_08800 [Symploca sp. SIO2G7]|nr:hypothetical protein [Symploca sp. SIO2G7]
MLGIGDFSKGSRILSTPIYGVCVLSKTLYIEKPKEKRKIVFLFPSSLSSPSSPNSPSPRPRVRCVTASLDNGISTLTCHQYLFS